jgi:hypothetical protein
MSRYPARWLLEDALSSTTRALEALDDCEVVLAEQILAGLARDLEIAIAGAPGIWCGNCHLRFDWPGQLAHHMRFVHWGEDWKAPLKHPPLKALKRSRAA